MSVSLFSKASYTKLAYNPLFRRACDDSDNASFYRDSGDTLFLANCRAFITRYGNGETQKKEIDAAWEKPVDYEFEPMESAADVAYLLRRIVYLVDDGPGADGLLSRLEEVYNLLAYEVIDAARTKREEVCG